MLSLRCFTEWKKLMLLFIGLYGILLYYSCAHLWKRGIRNASTTLSSTEGLPTLSWNQNEVFSKTNISVDSPTKELINAEPSIAIGGGITCKRLGNIDDNNMGKKFHFFHTLLPTFCDTASQHFVYKFYLAYDRNDRVFANQRLSDAFRRQFQLATTAAGSCSDRGIITNMSSFVECDHAGKPTWAQNDAMLEAYLDNVDYFYRINDDTKMLTGGWTEKFISTLERYDPPRVGVVGPSHSGGNVRILTYDFVHRTHVDVFGFYYPRLFTDWWGDNWMTNVYKPNRSTKIGNIRLRHTLGLGTRYRVHRYARRHLGDQQAHDAAIIKR